MRGNCDACGKHRILERCHIRSRGAGGSDDDWNILHMDRVCHQFQHQCGFVRLIYLYPNLLKILNNKGWELENVFGVTKLVRKEAQT